MKKSIFLTIVFLVFLGFIVKYSAQGQQEQYVKVKIDLTNKQFGALMQLGLSEEGDYKKGSWFITEVPASSIEKLSTHGFSYKILENDMTKFYQNRNKKLKSVSKDGSFCPSLIPNYNKPSHFKHGSMGGYLTYSELMSELDSMHFYFPNLISSKAAIDTFHTIEGRSTYFVKISDNVGTDEDEPEALYLSLTHAREPMGMQQLVWFMWYLLENYGTNPEITYLVNNSELFFIPVVNSDGYVYNQTTDPAGGGMWRKNRRANLGGSMGVDLNRNYGFEWGYDDVGSSTDLTAETYRGTSGFSEPETQTIKWFCEHRNLKLLIDYHTYSNILLYPWGYIDQTTPDQPVFDAYAQLLTSDNHFQYGTPGQLLYTTNGGSFDWFYGEQNTKGKIIAFSPEAGSPDDGFWPAEERIDELCNTFATMNLMIARLTNKYAKITNTSSNIVSSFSNQVHYNASILGLDTTGVYTVSLTSADIYSNTVGTPKQYSNVHLLQQINDSISFNMTVETPTGTEFHLLLNISNGDFSYTDTLTFIYGNPTLAYSDSCNSMAEWTSSGDPWITATSTYVSAPSCITDGNGNYADNTSKSITTTQLIPIPVDSKSWLNFMANWNLEKGYDYVQLTASEDNGINWVSLCGKYTSEGSVNQIASEPLYDGAQNQWVKEEIDLTEFAGKQLKFRFLLVSDAAVNEDGFYFDDFKVYTMPITTIGVPHYPFVDNFQIYPNPNQGLFSVSTDVDCISLEVFNMLGESVYLKAVDKSTTQIDLSRFSKGSYILKLVSKSGDYCYRKILVY